MALRRVRSTPLGHLELNPELEPLKDGQFGVYLQLDTASKRKLFYLATERQLPAAM